MSHDSKFELKHSVISMLILLLNCCIKLLWFAFNIYTYTVEFFATLIIIIIINIIVIHVLRVLFVTKAVAMDIMFS